MKSQLACMNKFEHLSFNDQLEVISFILPPENSFITDTTALSCDFIAVFGGQHLLR